VSCDYSRQADYRANAPGGVCGASDDVRRAAPEAAAKPPLGNNTKSSSPLGMLNTCPDQQRRGIRADRYRLQNVIRKLHIAKSEFDPLNPDFEVYNKLPRVVKCHRCRILPTVDIMRDPEKMRAYFRNITACGSVWDCPICSAKILEIRRQEIAQGVGWAYSEGFKVVLVSLTTPHYAYQTCSDLLHSFAQALKYLRSGKSWQLFKLKVSMQGFIRGLETLYGSNGWHNHTHELWIVDQDTDVEELKHQVLSRWELACKKYGLLPRGKVRAFREHAVDVQDNASCSDYLAKHDDKNNLSWGVDRELTNPLSKASKELLHPFQLADLCGKGDEKAGDLFKEYSQAFKGKASVYWSPGLKKRCLDEDITDQEAAEIEPVEPEDIASIEAHGWSVVLNERSRALLLSIAEEYGFEGVDDWLRKRGLNAVRAYEFKYQIESKGAPHGKRKSL